MTATNLLTAVRLLSNTADVFGTKCIDGIEADEARCRELVERSLAMVTVLAPKIGYDAAAKVAKGAFASGQSVREYVLEHGLVDSERLDELLDPTSMTEPS